MDYFGAQGAHPPDPVGAGHAFGPPWAWSHPLYITVCARAHEARRPASNLAGLLGIGSAR